MTLADARRATRATARRRRAAPLIRALLPRPKRVCHREGPGTRPAASHGRRFALHAIAQCNPTRMPPWATACNLGHLAAHARLLVQRQQLSVHDEQAHPLAHRMQLATQRIPDNGGSPPGPQLDAPEVAARPPSQGDADDLHNSAGTSLAAKRRHLRPLLLDRARTSWIACFRRSPTAQAPSIASHECASRSVDCGPTLTDTSTSECLAPGG